MYYEPIYFSPIFIQVLFIYLIFYIKKITNEAIFPQICVYFDRDIWGYGDITIW